jgi:hypothetical protein
LAVLDRLGELHGVRVLAVVNFLDHRDGVSKRRASTLVFGYMIFGTRTRRGFSLAARISRA